MGSQSRGGAVQHDVFISDLELNAGQTLVIIIMGCSSATVLPSFFLSNQYKPESLLDHTCAHIKMAHCLGSNIYTRAALVIIGCTHGAAMLIMRLDINLPCIPYILILQPQHHQ